MTEFTATFTFEGDEIFAIHEGKVIASGKDMPSVESDAVEYLESLTSERKKTEADNKKKKATHIITPNGVKGEILGRTPSVWGEQITARFANGRIATFTTHGSDDVEWITESIKTASANDPVSKLAARLDADFGHDRNSLVERQQELRALAAEAHKFINNGAPHEVEVKLDAIRTAAEAESAQIKLAIDHLDSEDAEGFVPEAPFATHAVEQADLGQKNDWLDVTTQQMIDESEGQDFDKLLSEGPSVFVTDLDDGALANAGVTREMALSHIVAKTSGFQGEEIQEYRERFIARTEVARRHELASRKVTTHKEAAAAEEVQTNTSDEALFM